MGVVTFNGEYKNYGISGYNMASRRTAAGFPIFEGNAYDASLMYLVPGTVGIGQLQPYIRYAEVMPIHSTNRNNYEAGLNYIINGHNARVSLYYQYSDLLTKGFINYDDTVTGSHVHSLNLGFQLQI
jgi:hypothetical protein